MDFTAPLKLPYAFEFTPEQQPVLFKSDKASLILFRATKGD